MEEETKRKKSIFETPLLSTKVKSADAKLFPEGLLGYFVGPTLALIANSVMSNYFNMYMSNVLGVNNWAKDFFTWLPVLSVIMVIAGNIVIGRLMDHSRTKAGKARPLLLLAIPLSVLALLVIYVFMPSPADLPEKQTLVLVLLAIGYNLWFAIAYPFYYTSHAALVNLSTRNSKMRSLLATIANATALAAVGACTMILPFFLNYLFVYQTSPEIVGQVDGALAVFKTDYVKALGGNYTDMLGNPATFYLNIGGVNTEIGKNPELYAMFDTNYFTLPFATFMALKAAGTIPAEALEYYTDGNHAALYDQVASYNAWKVFVIALMVLVAIGALLEYYFTRERITEESFKTGIVEKKKSTPLLKQAKICFKDKCWIIMILFFVLYQFGGMLKNVSQLYYCQAMFPNANGVYTTVEGGIWSGQLAIYGAIPTALGMVIAWPLSNKIGKGPAILFGAILATVGGAIGFIAPDNFICVTASFMIKALGSTPAMYLSLALLADILDHQEAQHKVRTDGLTMTIYGAIMAGMTGLATGVMNAVITATGYDAVNGVISTPQLRTAMPWVFIGGETLCYILIAVMFIFMRSEKFSKFDQKAIALDQKADAEARGEEYVSPAEKMRLEEEQFAAEAEKARIEALKAKCEKKGLNFEEEEKKFEDARAAKEAAAAQKKAAAEAKKAEKERLAKEKFDALPEEQKAAIEAKKAEKAKKQAERDAKNLVEFNKLRVAAGRPELVLGDDGEFTLAPAPAPAEPAAE